MRFRVCPWCEHTHRHIEDECYNCGFTGKCAICKGLLSADVDDPQVHDGECAREAAEEERTDSWN